jgi:hypothetical protein
MNIVARKPILNQWNNSYIQPGPVGSVGDVHLRPKWRTSTPDMAPRYDPTFSGKNQLPLGSNVQDGQHASWDTGGGPPRTNIDNIGNYRVVGQLFQSVIPQDRDEMAFLQPVKNQRWNSVMGAINKELTSGEAFLPLPNGYGYNKADGSIPRGGAFPTIIDITGGVTLPRQPQGRKQLGRLQSTRAMNRGLALKNWGMDATAKAKLGSDATAAEESRFDSTVFITPELDMYGRPIRDPYGMRLKKQGGVPPEDELKKGSGVPKKDEPKQNKKLKINTQRMNPRSGNMREPKEGMRETLPRNIKGLGINTVGMTSRSRDLTVRPRRSREVSFRDSMRLGTWF